MFKFFSEGGFILDWRPSREIKVEDRLSIVKQAHEKGISFFFPSKLTPCVYTMAATHTSGHF